MVKLWLKQLFISWGREWQSKHPIVSWEISFIDNINNRMINNKQQWNSVWPWHIMCEYEGSPVLSVLGLLSLQSHILAVRAGVWRPGPSVSSLSASASSWALSRCWEGLWGVGVHRGATHIHTPTHRNRSQRRFEAPTCTTATALSLWALITLELLLFPLFSPEVTMESKQCAISPFVVSNQHV